MDCKMYIMHCLNYYSQNCLQRHCQQKQSKTTERINFTKVFEYMVNIYIRILTDWCIYIFTQSNPIYLSLLITVCSFSIDSTKDIFWTISNIQITTLFLRTRNSFRFWLFDIYIHHVIS